MKLKYALYSVFALAALFAAGAGYLAWSGRSGASASAVKPLMRDRGKAVSSKPGKLLLAYSGDINGTLGPCG